MTLPEYRNAFKRGDNEPMRYIFEEYGTYCVVNLQRKTQCSPDDAKDAFIEAVMSFRERVMNGKITEISNLRSYLYTTCINMQLAKRRKGLRLIDHQERIKIYFYEVFDGEQPMEATEEEKKQLFDLCLAMLNKVGKKCKELLQAFYVREQNIDEIVANLNYSGKDVVKSTKSRCLKKWREEIGKNTKALAQ